MSSYQEYKKTYEDRQKRYNLPALDDMQIWFNISDFAYPEHLVLWDIAQGVSHHYNLISLILESLVTGQIRYAALYEMKKLSVDERKEINNMWGQVQSFLWKFNKINLLRDESKVAALIADGANFWVNTYVPFANKYYNLLERVWISEEQKEKTAQFSYYE